MATTFQVNQEIYYTGIYGPKKSNISRTVTQHSNNVEKYNVAGEPDNIFFLEEELAETENELIDQFSDKVGGL